MTDAAGQAPCEAFHLVFLDKIHVGLTIENPREPAECQVHLFVFHLHADRRTIVVWYGRHLWDVMHSGMAVSHGHDTGEVHVRLHEVDDAQTRARQLKALFRLYYRRHWWPVYAQAFQWTSKKKYIIIKV